MPLPNVAVFCASSRYVDERYMAIAARLGTLMAEKSLTLVYGGGDIGLMGVLARAVHAGGGRVVGVIPNALRDIEGVAYEIADELVLTDTMSERKRLIVERSQAFIVLPGGFGTLEEFLEVVTLKKLGYHAHPIVLVNPEGFFDGLLEFFDLLRQARFVGPDSPALFDTVETPEAIFETAAFRDAVLSN